VHGGVNTELQPAGGLAADGWSFASCIQEQAWSQLSKDPFMQKLSMQARHQPEPPSTPSGFNRSNK